MKITASSEAIFEWDVINWSKAIKFWEANSSNILPNNNALEIGAHNGGLSLWLALKDMQVVCSDLNYPTEIARQKHKIYRISNLITYEKISVLEIPYKNEIDIVIFKSVLGGVGSNQNYANIRIALQNIYTALKPGGELLFVENLKGSPLHQLLRRKYVRWGKSWNYLSIDELVDFTSMFNNLEYQTIGFLGAFGPNKKFRRLFGKIDKLIFDKITPQDWRYIFMGVARK